MLNAVKSRRPEADEKCIAPGVDGSALRGIVIVLERLDIRTAAPTRPASPAAGVVRVRSDRGFTLIELLIAMTMFAVVMLAVLAMFDSASRAGSNESERNTAISEETTGLSRMVGEIRQAYHIIGPTSASSSDWIDFLIRTPLGSSSQADYRVIYNCKVADPTSGKFNACWRYQSLYSPSTGLGGAVAGVPPPGASSSVVVPRVINRTASDPNDYVFTGLTSPQGTTYGPTYGAATIRTPSAGNNTAFKYDNYTHDVVLSDSFYIRQLDFGR